MRKLKNYLTFNSAEFFKDKRVHFVSGKLNDDGVKINAIIMDDKTVYGKDEDNEDITGLNIAEKFSITVPKGTKVLLNQFKSMDVIELYDYKSAKVWGTYNENLSVVCNVKKANATQKHRARSAEVVLADVSNFG